MAPTLQRDADAYELRLADILISNGVVSITADKITDLRSNSVFCGKVDSLIAGDINSLVAAFNEHKENNVKHGYAIYSDSIPANSSLTKTIAVGVMAHKTGQLIIRSSLPLTSVNNFRNGTFITLSTDQDNNLVVSGAFATHNNHTAYSRRQATSITTAIQADSSTGVAGIIIDKAYIEGENIIIVFKNTTAGALSLSCNVDWEVM